MGGLYCCDTDIADVVEKVEAAGAGVMAHAIDPDEAARLWTVSAALTGVNALQTA
jgi:hypothetical protein